MARNRSPAEDALKAVIAQAVTPALRAAAFRKTDLNYHRKHGETAQVVNVQVSHGSTALEKMFYINAGIAFDALCRLAGLPILERPREYQCDDRGTRDRPEALIPGSPERWSIRAGEDIGGTVASLRDRVERLTVELDRIDGAEAYRRHPWFDRFRPTPCNARILYVLGDHDEAWREVQDLAAFFSDRQNANRAEWWIERLRLTGLESRLVGRVS